MNEVQRDVRIDCLKGLGIVLVVLGHVIQSAVPDYGSNLVFSMIYSFHMPLFMLLSGYVAKVSSKKYVLKRFETLCVPFVCWIFISYLINGEWKVFSVIEKILLVIESPDNGLWFLWVLFLNSVLLWLCTMFAKRFELAEWKVILPVMLGLFYMVFPVISVWGTSINTGMAGIGMVQKYFFYFAGGYLCKQHGIQIRKKHVVIGIIIFSVMMIDYRWSEGIAFWQNMYGKMPTIFWDWGNRTLSGILALAGCISACYLFRFIENWSWGTGLGRFSGDIYILHGWFVGCILPSQDEWYGIAIRTVIIIACAIVTAIIVRKNRVISYFLLGRR